MRGPTTTLCTQSQELGQGLGHSLSGLTPLCPFLSGCGGLRGQDQCKGPKRPCRGRGSARPRSSPTSGCLGSCGERHAAPRTAESAFGVCWSSPGGNCSCARASETSLLSPPGWGLFWNLGTWTSKWLPWLGRREGIWEHTRELPAAEEPRPGPGEAGGSEPPGPPFSRTSDLSVVIQPARGQAAPTPRLGAH